MNRKYILFGIGGASLAFVLFMFTYDVKSEQSNVLIDNQMLDPEESKTVTKVITESNQRMQLIVHYPLFSASINAKVFDPAENKILDVNATSYDKELYSEFLGGTAGSYTIVLTNFGDQSVPIHVILGSIENQKPS
jgi:hypothetical protein